jgi:hypothetical protein
MACVREATRSGSSTSRNHAVHLVTCRAGSSMVGVTGDQTTGEHKLASTQGRQTLRPHRPNNPLVRHANALCECPFVGVDRKWSCHGQNDAIDPNRKLRAPRRELCYPPSNAMGRFNEAADPQMALAARAERPRVLAGPHDSNMAWHPHLLGAARPRRRGDRMSAPGKLVRSSRWKTGPSKG